MPKTKATAKVKKAISSKKIIKIKSIKKVAAATRSRKKVSAIPKGYHSVTPYLIVDGAAKAIEFYKKAFGAKVGLKMEQPDGKKIGHAELKIGDSMIMLADECPQTSTPSPKAYGGAAVGFHLYVKDVDKTVARAVAAGAKLIKPIENMFYGDRCGRVEDQYGHQWHISTHIEDVSPREQKKRAAQLFGKK
jgi:PhnB protein